MLFTYFCNFGIHFHHILSLTLIVPNVHIIWLSIWFVYFNFLSFLPSSFIFLCSDSYSTNARENSVRTSQETRYVSATKPNRLMLFRERIAVYCENHMEHTNTLCGRNAVYINSVRTSQETHYVSATNPNQLCCLSNVQAGGTYITTVL
jgi:hypothetical protein